MRFLAFPHVLVFCNVILRSVRHKAISVATKQGLSIDISKKQREGRLYRHISRQSNKQREYLPISAQADFVSVGEQINKKSKQKLQIDNYINFAIDKAINAVFRRIYYLFAQTIALLRASDHFFYRCGHWQANLYLHLFQIRVILISDNKISRPL